MRRARLLCFASDTRAARSSKPSPADPLACSSRFKTRLPDDADAASSFAWLQGRFASFQNPARADLETAVSRIERAEDLDAAFATMKSYRQNAIPLTQETAAVTVAACLRAEKPDVAAHVLYAKLLQPF